MKGVKLRAAILAAGTLLSAQGWSVTGPPHFEHRNVVFGEGSSRLSQPMKTQIQSLAHEIGDATVIIVGRDDPGVATAELAQARAKMISATLRAAGVPRAHMVLKAEQGAAPTAPQRLESQVSWAPRAPPTAADSGSQDHQAALDKASSNPQLSMGLTPPHVMRWEVKTSDVTLLRTLERWALDAGFKLKWDAAKNFLIGASDVYTGSFEEALQAVLSSAGIRLSDYPLEACIYGNTPPLVRITRQGDQVRECDAFNALAP